MLEQHRQGSIISVTGKSAESQHDLMHASRQIRGDMPAFHDACVGKSMDIADVSVNLGGYHLIARHRLPG